MLDNFFVHAARAPSGPGSPRDRGFTITHGQTTHSVGLLWTSDQTVAETSYLVKFYLEQATKAQRRSRCIALLFLQPRRQMGMGGQRHAPAALPPGKRPGTHCIGGWVGPRAGLDGCGKSRPPPGFDPRTVQPVASRYTD